MYSKEKQKEHMSQIRRILVMRPDVTILEVRELLQKQRKPLKLDKDYINRLVNKIRKERAKRMDYYTVNKVLAEFQDEIDELKRRLWMIINNPDSTYSEKITAIRELRNNSKDLFDKMFDAGVFERQIGKLKTEGELSEGDKELLRKALKYAGLPKHTKEDRGGPAVQEETGKE